MLATAYRSATIWVIGGMFGGMISNPAHRQEGARRWVSSMRSSVTRAGVGMHGDGDGLWLFVTKRKDDTLMRRWVFRYRRS